MVAYIVMGVSGCGKSEIGKGFARAIGGRFFDGDDLHPAENIAKMSRGEPLDDNDRAPWLDKVGRQLGQSDGPTVIACSALKRAYRQKITEMAGRPVTFLYLEGTRELLSERMKHRDGHFMPVALLDSQLDTLEPPGPDELSVKASIDQTPDEVVEALIAGIRRKQQ
ncbi:gluconokinase [Roseibium sp. MMSF_3544]|uniref:gluconokinase n=1 Tax=unclassified Roseibium TaxID=2629323 RepID=UPI00273E62F5|nr:gluconokinase [Roseibium sp. MMSF_3544]